MPIEKKPMNPHGAKRSATIDPIPYKVRTGDTWVSLAKKCQVTPQQLIDYNFDTNSSAEVNWCLRYLVGCKEKTKDGSNWVFSNHAHPGMIDLPMIKAPVTLVTRDYKGPGAQPYKTQDGDTWESLARKYGVPDAKTLMEFNFKTSDPKAVNWYLVQMVGCKIPTRDGMTFEFHLDDNPGIIYFPPYVKGLPSSLLPI